MSLNLVEVLLAVLAFSLAMLAIHREAAGSEQNILVMPAIIVTGLVALCRLSPGFALPLICVDAVEDSLPAMWLLCVSGVYVWRLWNQR